jgi:hypothetical protein
MDKRELVSDMRRYCGGSFITRKKLADYMGVKDPKNIDKYIRGLERVEGKYYFVPDVASSLKGKCII